LYCERESIVVTHAYADEGVSGADMARPGLLDMMRDSKEGLFQIVVTPKLDRIARDLMGQLVVEHALKTAGVRLVSVAEPFAADDPQSVLMRQILGAFAQFERAIIAARTMGGRRAKRKAGGHASGAAPLGYRVEGRELVPDDTQHVVAAAYYLRGENPGASLRAIAAMLNEAGFRTRQGTEFHAESVRRLFLRERLYLGRMPQGDGTDVEGRHAAILGPSAEVQPCS
jgi:DNA invertase Pin-like site-specific DNA recombinase